MKARNYKQLVVWQKAIQLAKSVYAITQSFPKSEIYGLTAQIRRCAVSIPSNVAEGNSRHSRSDYARFVCLALGSLFEMETQLLISREVGYVTADEYERLVRQVDEVEAMLASLHRRLQSSQ